MIEENITSEQMASVKRSIINLNKKEVFKDDQIEIKSPKEIISDKYDSDCGGKRITCIEFSKVGRSVVFRLRYESNWGKWHR